MAVALAGAGTYMDFDPLSGAPCLLGATDVQAIAGEKYVSQMLYNLAGATTPAPGYSLEGAPDGLKCDTPTAVTTTLSATNIENPFSIVDDFKDMIESDGEPTDTTLSFSKTSSVKLPTVTYSFTLKYEGVTPPPASVAVVNELELTLTVVANTEDAIDNGLLAIEAKKDAVNGG